MTYNLAHLWFVCFCVWMRWRSEATGHLVSIIYIVIYLSLYVECILKCLVELGEYKRPIHDTECAVLLVKVNGMLIICFTSIMKIILCCSGVLEMILRLYFGFPLNPHIYILGNLRNWVKSFDCLDGDLILFEMEYEDLRDFCRDFQTKWLVFGAAVLLRGNHDPMTCPSHAWSNRQSPHSALSMSNVLWKILL
jgi:hypothetical protein